MKKLAILLCIGSLMSVGTAYAQLSVQQGGIGTSTVPAGYVLVGNSALHLTAVATTTASCSGSASCTPFTVFGSTPVTISASGSGGGGLATSSPWTALNLVQVKNDGTVTSIATSSLGLTTSSFSSANISQWTNNSGYLTGNQTITLSGDESGSGTTAITTSFNLANTHWWTARQNFTNASTSEFTATSSAWFTSLATAAGTFLAVDPNGLLIATSTPINTGGASEGVQWATAAVLSGTPTYGNGSSGVGATLTEVGSGALSVDGNSPAASDRVLVKNQASAFQNGIYVVTATGSGIASYILTRSSDYNTPTEITPGLTTYVVSGTANNDTTWAVSYTSPLSIGTTNLTYTEVSGGGAAVTSVSNSDGTLTISPTAGVVVASLALAHANAWTGLQQFNSNASSSLESTNQFWVGGTASSTFTKTGTALIGTTTPSTSASLYVSATTSQAGTNLVVNVASSTGTSLLNVNGNGTVTIGSLSGAASFSAGVLSAGTLSLANGGTNATSCGTTNAVWYYDGTRFVCAANMTYNGSSGQLLTVTNASTTNFSAATTLYTPVTSALIVTDANKKAAAYGGTSCTNQVPTSMSALGAWTCSSVTDSFFSGQLALSHGGTNASLTGASGLVAMNSGNTALSIPSTSYTLSSSLLTAPNASTTNLTAGTSLQIPTASNPAPTVKGYIAQSTNSPYQLQAGNNAGGTTVFDNRWCFTIQSPATSTAWTGTTTQPQFAIPTGLTITSEETTVQPQGATLEIAWQYANPTAYTTVGPFYAPASSTPGVYVLSSNNTPATQATTTISYGNPTGSPTAAATTLCGTPTGI